MNYKTGAFWSYLFISSVKYNFQKFQCPRTLLRYTFKNLSFKVWKNYPLKNFEIRNVPFPWSSIKCWVFLLLGTYISLLDVKVRNMKVDFNTEGTWRRVRQWTLMMKIYDFFLFDYRIYAHLTRGLNELHEFQIRGKSKVGLNSRVIFRGIY